jgi:hypothetical protein
VFLLPAMCGIKTCIKLLRQLVMVHWRPFPQRNIWKIWEDNFTLGPFVLSAKKTVFTKLLKKVVHPNAPINILYGKNCN